MNARWHLRRTPGHELSLKILSRSLIVELLDDDIGKKHETDA